MLVSQWDRNIFIHTIPVTYINTQACKDAHIHSAHRTLSATTSSLGPVITPAAPLGRPNVMAWLLVLERDVMRGVMQRAEDNSLIDVGWVVWSWRGRRMTCDH